MKRFHTYIISGLFCALAAACAHENASNGNEPQGKPDAEQKVTIFSSNAKAISPQALTTRTSIVHTPGGTTTAFWEKDDKIWVEKSGTLRASVSSDVTTKAATANFTLLGTYTAANYMVYYTGANSTAGDRVTIPATQTQTAANSTTHFGTSGDCGVANAAGDGENYDFALDHKAAYLCFLPRTTATSLVNGFLIQSITVTSDDDIAGEYAFTAAGIGSATGTTSKTITLNVPNLPLTNTATNQTLNAAYMVIRPQHTPVALNITYKLHNPVTNITGTLTKTLPAQKYDVNTVYDIRANLVPKDFTEETKGYMWDAKREYFWGKTPPYNFSTDRPQSKAADPDRWYNDVFVANTVSHATQSCKDCPTGVQLVWYCVTEPYGNAEELWTASGKIYKGVVRFKKWADIVAEDGGSLTTIPTNSSIGGFPLMAAGPIEDPTGRNSDPKQGLPSPSAMNKYFVVPAAQTENTYEVKYWASTTIPTATFDQTAFMGMPVSYIGVSPDLLWVGGSTYIQRNRNTDGGMRAMKFE